MVADIPIAYSIVNLNIFGGTDFADVLYTVPMQWPSITDSIF